MPNIHIERQHNLGLTKARKAAWQWAEDAERDFEMSCTVEEGKDEDLVHFTRSGVSGTLLVTSERFELDARLGLLVGAFAKQIQSQIEQQLDKLLDDGAGSAGKGASKTVASKTAAKKAPAAKPKK